MFALSLLCNLFPRSYVTHLGRTSSHYIPCYCKNLAINDKESCSGKLQQAPVDIMAAVGFPHTSSFKFFGDFKDTEKKTEQIG